MMEEVSVMMAYDAQFAELMSEEEILACLVEDTGPNFSVPSKKAKLKESRLQIMDDDDCLEKYLRENERLQQASLRLEQENDNLAHKLISSKVSLRTALDKSEDTVDSLTKDLMLVRRQLKATEEEKRDKGEEAAMLKDVFRRELEKAEQEVKRSSGIIADYKQICTQLTHRLERQQFTHKQDLESLKSSVKACSHCGHVLELNREHDSGERSIVDTENERTMESKDSEDASAEGEDRDKVTLRAQIRELEQELASTKLQMVEAKCKIQELEHQKGILANDLHDAKNSWISKAFTSLRTSSHSGKHDGPVSGRGSLKLSWPHRDHRENM